LDIGQLQLAVFLVHCFGTFSLTCLIWTGQLGIGPLIGSSADWRGRAPELISRLRPFYLSPALIELVTGFLLLISARWRDSAFGPTFVLLLGVLLWELALRRRLLNHWLSGKDDSAHRKWLKAGWLSASIWTLRSFLMIVIALY